jgi:hypothetical protein
MCRSTSCSSIIGPERASAPRTDPRNRPTRSPADRPPRRLAPPTAHPHRAGSGSCGALVPTDHVVESWSRTEEYRASTRARRPDERGRTAVPVGFPLVGGNSAPTSSGLGRDIVWPRRATMPRATALEDPVDPIPDSRFAASARAAGSGHGRLRRNDNVTRRAPNSPAGASRPDSRGGRTAPIVDRFPQLQPREGLTPHRRSTIWCQEGSVA